MVIPVDLQADDRLGFFQYVKTTQPDTLLIKQRVKLFRIEVKAAPNSFQGDCCSKLAA